MGVRNPVAGDGLTGPRQATVGSVSVPCPRHPGMPIMRETGSSDTAERLEIHNVSVDEQVAQAHLCGQVHLPKGRTCVEHTGHSGSCKFEAPQQAHEIAQRVLRNA